MGNWGAALPAGDGDLLDPAAGVAMRWSAELGLQEPSTPPLLPVPAVASASTAGSSLSCVAPQQLIQHGVG
jgi:hypothetical protein